MSVIGKHESAIQAETKGLLYPKVCVLVCFNDAQY
jgi:hypothetical protein